MKHITFYINTIIFLIAITFLVTCGSREFNNPHDSRNLTDNTASSTDITPPTFSGITLAAPVNYSQINLLWLPAVDDKTSPGKITYYIYQNINEPVINFDTPAYKITGVAFYSIIGLDPSTKYYFVVRAKDEAGNLTANIEVKSATTHHGFKLINTFPETDARALSLKDTYAYVTDYSGGLKIIDISDPSSPVLTGAFDTITNPVDVDISGDYAYVLSETSGLYIINITSPDSPSLTSHYDTEWNAAAVYVKNSYAYIAGKNKTGLLIMDISSPSSPHLKRSLLSDTVTDVFADTDFLYSITTGDSNLFNIIDIKNPDQPVTAGTYTFSSVPTSIYVNNDTAYIETDTGLVILNISSPDSIYMVGSFDSQSLAFGGDVCVNGNYALFSGIYLLKTSNLPLLISSYNLTGNVYDLEENNGYLYAANGSSGIRIFKW